MKVHDCQQGTTEWLYLRAGIPTASEFENILTRKGSKSESRERYKLTLLAERLMEHPCQEFVSNWMQRGKDEEARAAAFYEFQREAKIVRVGFITDDDETRGCSPDGLVGADGLVEIKSPSEWVHVGYLMRSGKAYDKYMVQVQGQLLICEDRQWVDVMSYHPEMPEALIRIERDLKYLALLDEAVSEFCHELESDWARIVADGWASRTSKPVKLSMQNELMRAMKESLIAIRTDA
jgi:hypothetical protein